jgi:hypothetical protein
MLLYNSSILEQGQCRRREREGVEVVVVNTKSSSHLRALCVESTSMHSLQQRAVLHQRIAFQRRSRTPLARVRCSAHAAQDSDDSRMPVTVNEHSMHGRSFDSVQWRVTEGAEESRGS